MGDAWADARELMQAACGVVLAEDQRYLLEARLVPVARAHGLESAEACVAGARSSTRLAEAVVDALTTHETSFFRDASFWKVFETAVVPRLLESRRDRPLRVWSAACSTGQEAWTLAMLLEERWPELAARTEVVGTDVSHGSLERARAGLFTSLEVNRGIGAARLLRFFEQAPGGFRVKPRLRERVRWEHGNLLTSPAPVGCQLVLCRNVLIYFSPSDRQRVCRRLREAVDPDGFVGVGASELLDAPALGPGWYEAERLRRPR